ncbi:MAG: hypothetical protein GVX78_05340 [Bacteroidetes bacterium]|jgi:hypothetical protein|nr:hypothetical protein [Bacteroidota bacterium]
MNPIGKPAGIYYFCHMHRKRFFLSLLLMLAYFMGLAHDLIPHVHESQLANNKTVVERTVCKSECQEPISIQHADHHDHGLIHLLACLLSNVEHPDGDCDQVICSQVQQKDSRQFRSLSAMAVMPSALFFPMEERRKSLNLFAYFSFRLSSSCFSSLFDRGPPALIL